METVKVIIPKEEIQKRIKELAKSIEEYYRDEEIYAVCVLKGGVIFTINLLSEISRPYEMTFMSVSSYGSGKTSSGEITVNLDMDEDLTGKNVLFIEDIVDSGRTLDFLIKRAKERNAKDVKVCTLLYKPECRVFDVKMDFIGFEIEDKFIVGYGLDYNQKYRNLKYIGYVVFED